MSPLFCLNNLLLISELSLPEESLKMVVFDELFCLLQRVYFLKLFGYGFLCQEWQVKKQEQACKAVLHNLFFTPLGPVLPRKPIDEVIDFWSIPCGHKEREQNKN